MKNEEIKLKMPVKARKSDNYLVVLEDADGVIHYWSPDGNYDGYDAPRESEMGKKLQNET